MDADNNRTLKITEQGKGVIAVPKGRGSYLLTKFKHADLHLKVDFMVPKGSNSGIYFMGRYEVQVKDSWGKKKVNFGDCGGIYRCRGKNKDRGHSPKLNASLPPGEWQNYDITFRAPRFDKSGKKTANACFVKVVLNGKTIHKNVEVTGPTISAMKEFDPEEAFGPLRIQGDHGPVAYKNLVIQKLSLK
jgi:hypothetical protein